MNAAEREAVLAKVRKCMALSQSSEPGEAAAALRMAQAIMEKNNIKAAEVEASEVDCADIDLGDRRRSARFFSWANALVATVASAFGSTPVVNMQTNHVTFYGLNGAGEVSGYAFEVIYRKVKRQRKLYMKQLSDLLSRRGKILRADAFATGWVYGAGENVIPRKVQEEEERKMAAKIAQEVGRVETKKHKPSAEVTAHGMAMNQGYEKGKQFQLRQGVGSEAAALAIEERK